MDRHVFVVSRMLSVGRREVVAAGRLAVMALITLGLAGSPLQRSQAGEPSRPAGPSAAVGKIVFAAGEGGGMITRSIYVINDDGTGRTQLTSGSDSGAPAWSPDGTKIAYTSDPDGDFDYDIYVMNADGSGVQQLTTNLESDTGPAWSPDGSRIAFARGGSDNYWIVTMAANGTDETEIASDGVGPHWSPDGNKIVFSRWSSNLLFVVDANGDNIERLISDSGLAYEQSPEWSPDGSKVAFSGATMYGEIFTVGQAGNNLTQVTDSADESSEPTWSPNGNKIAFIEGGTALHTIGTGGAGEQTLLTGSEILSDPDWFGTPDNPPPDNPHGCTLFVPEDDDDWWNDFKGTQGDDVICGTNSLDNIDGWNGDDKIYGGAETDMLFGGRGDDSLYGGPADDTFDGEKGKDHAYGGAGNELFYAQDGQPDVLDGGPGNKDCAVVDKKDDVTDIELFGHWCKKP